MPSGRRSATATRLDAGDAEAWKTLARQVDPARMASSPTQTRPENAPEDLTTPAADTASSFPAAARGCAGTGRAQR